MLIQARQKIFSFYMENIRLEPTQDGSFTLFSEQFQEIYHSRRGAVQESQHVFIQEGLEKASSFFAKKINLLEIGWGTGLNFVLTYQYLLRNPHVQVHYVALEPIPVPVDLVGHLPYFSQIGIKKELFLHFHHLDWNKKYDILPNFSFEKLNITLDEFYESPPAPKGGVNTKEETKFREENFDLIYFDAFAPSKQPEMWEINTLQQLYNLTNDFGFLVTYCAKGQLKRDLKTLGFTVESPNGAMGKREMTRARKNNNYELGIKN